MHDSFDCTPCLLIEDELRAKQKKIIAITATNLDIPCICLYFFSDGLAERPELEILTTQRRLTAASRPSAWPAEPHVSSFLPARHATSLPHHHDILLPVLSSPRPPYEYRSS